MLDASKDHSRVTPEGRACGKTMADLADRAVKILHAEGEPDERCKSCAFRAGTVPNGCMQTQADALKALCESTPFMCHAPRDSTVCHGWYALRVATRRVEERTGKKLPACDWKFSPPDV